MQSSLPYPSGTPVRTLQRLAIVAVVALSAVLVAPTTPALAQGDWSVKRDPFDAKVIARYKRILDRNPGDRGALRKLSQLYRKHRSIDKLVREYQQKLQKKPRSFSAAVILGHLHLDRGQSDQALTYYERASAMRPKSPTVQLALGDLYRQNGKITEARTAYRQVLDGKPKKVVEMQAVRALGELALSQGDIAEATRHYNRYFALDPRNIQARIGLGDALVQHGKHKEAIAVFKAAASRLRSDPARHVEVITRIGAAQEAAGLEDEAIRTYRQALTRVGKGYYLRKELIARVIDIYRRRQALGDLIEQYEKTWTERKRGHLEWDVLARLYEETGNQEKAIVAYRRATRKAPYELDTQRRLIALLENSGREDEALKQYEAVIRVAPGEPRFQLELAERYWRRNKDKQALALLAKMERRFPTDAGVHAAIADLYTRWGKNEQALAAHVRLTRIEPSDINHLVNLGEQYFQRNQKKKAVAVWKKIIARKTPANYARLGEVYAEHDMLDQALEMYRAAIKLEPKSPTHHKGRAGVHERHRHYDRAVADWEKVLALTPDKEADKPARREARRRIVNLLKRSRGSQLFRRVRTWEMAFKATPPDVEAGYFLVEAYLRERSFTKAQGVLERLLEIDKNDGEAMQQLVKVYKRAADYDSAVDLLVRLADQHPGRKREYYTEIAEIKTHQRRDDEAIEWITKAVESSPKDPVAHQRLAERYVEMVAFDKAIAAYEKTIELDKRNYRVYFDLARLYIYKDVPAKASALYREVLRRATDEAILRKAGEEAVSLEKMLGSLGGLERVITPLAFTFSHKPVYRRILVQLFDDYVPELVRAWHHGEPARRKAARAELDRLGSHGLKPLLEALSDDKDPNQQRIAVDVLGYLGNRGAAAPLVRLAQKPGLPSPNRRRGIGTLTPVLDWDVRVDALIAAGRLGDPRTIDALVGLARHSDKTMREAATFALGRTAHRNAVPALISTLGDSNASVKTLGCMGLAQIPGLRNDKRAVARIVEVVANRRNSDVSRAACAFALGHLGDSSAAQVLLDTLSRGNDEAQRMAAWALGRMGIKSATPALLRAYFSRRDQVRQMVGWALVHSIAGRPGEESPVRFDGYPRKRRKYDAGAAIAVIPGPLEIRWPSPTVVIGHESELIDGLRGALGRHRDMVVRVLEDLDSADDALGLGPLTADLSRVPVARRGAVRRSIAAIGRAIAPNIQELTGHRDTKVRALALSVMAKGDMPGAPEILTRSMSDERALIRLAAMRAAAAYVRIHGKQGPTLAAAVATRLGSDSWKARVEAADALGSFGKHASEKALITATRDSNAYVRERAVHALGRLARRSSLPAVLASLDDDLVAVQVAAVQSLAAIGGKRALVELGRVARSDRAPSVVRAAQKALKRTKN